MPQRLLTETEIREARPVLVTLLHRLQSRRERLTQEYLLGRPVDPTQQGRAASLHLVCLLLSLPDNELAEELVKER